MIVSQVIGGLGNQMFQYACGYSLAKKMGSDFRMDLSAFDSYKAWSYQLNLYHITAKAADKEVLQKFRFYWDAPVLKKINDLIGKFGGEKLKFKNPRIAKEEWPSFFKDLNKKGSPLYLEGYWQSADYFEEFADDIRNQFTLKKPLDVKNSAMLEQIKNTPCSVSLHVRRGDYLSSATTLSIHGILGKDYYMPAIKLMEESLNDPTFFVFSDDLNWVRDNLDLKKVVYVDINDINTGFMDLELMKNCHHHILANSTFSWWGAWLNTNPIKKIIMPIKWMGDPKNVPERIHIRGAQLL